MRKTKWFECFSLRDNLHELKLNYHEEKARFESFDTTRIEIDPLSTAEDNPWDNRFKDDELREIIKKDIVRALPEIDLFRCSKIQNILQDVLFCWVKLVGFKDQFTCEYRQGMHEIVAIIFLVVSEGDADVFKSEKLDKYEQETFVLFKELMHRASFIFTDVCVMECQRFYKELKAIDYELHRHLELLEIEPQFFGIRWIRLLFSREFELAKVLDIWDKLFNDFNLLVWIGVQMLIDIRVSLLSAEYTGAMELLMKYPPINVDKMLIKAEKLLKSKSIVGRLELLCNELYLVEQDVGRNEQQRLEKIRIDLGVIIQHVRVDEDIRFM